MSSNSKRLLTYPLRKSGTFVRSETMTKSQREEWKRVGAEVEWLVIDQVIVSGVDKCRPFWEEIFNA